MSEEDDALYPRKIKSKAEAKSRQVKNTKHFCMLLLISENKLEIISYSPSLAHLLMKRGRTLESSLDCFVLRNKDSLYSAVEKLAKPYLIRKGNLENVRVSLDLQDSYGEFVEKNNFTLSYLSKELAKESLYASYLYILENREIT